MNVKPAAGAEKRSLFTVVASSGRRSREEVSSHRYAGRRRREVSSHRYAGQRREVSSHRCTRAGRGEMSSYRCTRAGAEGTNVKRR